MQSPYHPPDPRSTDVSTGLMALSGRIFPLQDLWWRALAGTFVHGDWTDVRGEGYVRDVRGWPAYSGGCQRLPVFEQSPSIVVRAPRQWYHPAMGRSSCPPASAWRMLVAATILLGGCTLKPPNSPLVWADEETLAEPLAVSGRRVEGVDTATDLASKTDFSCASLRSGELACWGRSSLESDATPHLEDVVPDVARLAAGVGWICARHETGRWTCLEDRIRGFPLSVQSWPRPMSELTDAVQAAGGMRHVCSLHNDGHVWCWGANSVGQLGDGTTKASTRPVQVLRLADAVELVAGEQHTCARRATGTVSCWGSGARGKLGHGRTDDSATPVRVAGIRGAIALTAGAGHTCALRRSGKVACWGNNRRGQLTAGADAFASKPVTIAGLEDIVQLSAGELHTCALRRDSAVLCWGDGRWGQLGGRSLPVPPPRPALVAILGVAGVAAGTHHTCARLHDGGVTCWGGLLPGPPRSWRVFGLEDAVELAAGSDHMCARRATGQVACWGEGDHGQLGGGRLDVGATRGVEVAVELQRSVRRHQGQRARREGRA